VGSPASRGGLGIVADDPADDPADDMVARAAADARRAADDAGVVVRAAETVPEVEALIRVGEAVWGPQGTLATNEMRALAFAGSVVLGAFDREGGEEPVGFLIGFLGWNGGLHLHSHQTGVVPGRRRGGVGYALKLAQREICLRHGIAEVRWTFDPLIRRNTAFNLGRLGARAEQFLPDFYGRMSDALNLDDLSDRLEAVWLLADPLPARSAAGADGRIPGAGRRPGVLVDDGGWPAETAVAPAAGHHLAVPADFAGLRSGNPDAARAWRLAVRRVLSAAYADGLRIGSVDDDGYVLTAADA
jgi:predicted GNAT superfamily acetyltransferase